MTQLDHNICLAPMVEGDLAYLYDLCETTMAEYVIALWGEWRSVDVREHLRAALGRGEFQEILHKDIRVGALSVLTREEEILLDQIFIDPQFQNQGIGRVVVLHLIKYAVSAEKALRLSVLVTNPATKFYEGLGFSVIKEDQEKYWMEYAGNNKTA